MGELVDLSPLPLIYFGLQLVISRGLSTQVVAHLVLTDS